MLMLMKFAYHADLKLKNKMKSVFLEILTILYVRQLTLLVLYNRRFDFHVIGAHIFAPLAIKTQLRPCLVSRFAAHIAPRSVGGIQ